MVVVLVVVVVVVVVLVVLVVSNSAAALIPPPCFSGGSLVASSEASHLHVHRLVGLGRGSLSRYSCSCNNFALFSGFRWVLLVASDCSVVGLG